MLSLLRFHPFDEEKTKMEQLNQFNLFLSRELSNTHKSTNQDYKIINNRIPHLQNPYKNLMLVIKKLIKETIKREEIKIRGEEFT